MTADAKPVNILVTLDENYLPYLNVMLSSLLRFNPDCVFDVYLLHAHIPESALPPTRSVLEGHGRLIPIQVRDLDLENAPTTARYPQEIYYRIFAARYLPEDLDRILYLDPDLVVNGSILPLYRLPMDGYYFAAASHTKAFLQMMNSLRLDMDGDSPYINSGVILMNLPLLRKEQNFNDVFAYIEAHKNILLLPDQDVISALYGSKIYALDPLRYNLTERLFQINAPLEDGLEWVRRNAVIIHYCGRNKPWKEPYFGMLNVFYKEAEAYLYGEMPPKEMLLIVNPMAGMKKAEKSLTDILTAFNRAGYDTRVYVTACQGDAVGAVQRLSKNADLIVCCGGDGTLNETVTGILAAGLDIPVGYIPAGSTNDFAASLKLSLQMVPAAKQIIGGTPHIYDVGKFNDRYFTYVASFGAFTRTSYDTPQNVKNALGHLAYLLSGIQELTALRSEHLRIEIDGTVTEDDFLFGAVCNSTSVGGVLTLDPGMVDLCDGRFEVLLIRSPKSLQELQACLLALQNQDYHNEMITLQSASEIKITASPETTWTLDGERADGAEQIVIENLPRRLRLIH